MSAPNVLTSHAFVYFNANDADDDILIHTHEDDEESCELNEKLLITVNDKDGETMTR